MWEGGMPQFVYLTMTDLLSKMKIKEFEDKPKHLKY